MEQKTKITPANIGEMRENTLVTKDGKGEKHKAKADAESGLGFAENFDSDPSALGLSNDPATGRPQKPPRDPLNEPGRTGKFTNR